MKLRRRPTPGSAHLAEPRRGIDARRHRRCRELELARRADGVARSVRTRAVRPALRATARPDVGDRCRAIATRWTRRASHVAGDDRASAASIVRHQVVDDRRSRDLSSITSRLRGQLRARRGCRSTPRSPDDRERDLRLDQPSRRPRASQARRDRLVHRRRAAHSASRRGRRPASSTETRRSVAPRPRHTDADVADTATRSEPIPPRSHRPTRREASPASDADLAHLAQPRLHADRARSDGADSTGRPRRTMIGTRRLPPALTPGVNSRHDRDRRHDRRSGDPPPSRRPSATSSPASGATRRRAPTFESVNPADTRDVIGRFQQGTAADVAMAVRAAEIAGRAVAPDAGPEARRDPVRASARSWPSTRSASPGR